MKTPLSLTSCLFALMSILVLSGPAFAAGECSNWKVRSAKFQIQDSLNTTHNYTEFENRGGAAVIEVLWNTKILKGDLVVDQSCLQTTQGVTYLQKQTKIPMTAVLRLRGLNLRALAEANPNQTMTIYNLSGKTVEDFVGHWYGGFKLGVSVGVIVGANPGGAFLANTNNGIVIGDLERILEFGELAIGVNASWASIQFSLADDYYHNVTTSEATANPKESAESNKISTEELRKLRF